MNRKTFAVGLIVLSFVILQCGGGEEYDPPAELNVVLTFKDANGLRPGQFLVYKGVRVGEVTAVDLDGSLVKVHVEVGEKHRDQISKEATSTIEKLTFINPTGEHQLVMSDVGGVRTPVEEGTVIVGSEGLISTITNATTSALHSAAQMVNGSSAPPPPEKATTTTAE